MASEAQINGPGKPQATVEHEQPAVEEPSTTLSGAGESKPEAEPPGVPTAAPPNLPGGRLALSVQRMPLNRRWELSLGLALLSGFIFVSSGSISPIVTAIGSLMLFGLALTAGFVLSSWPALLALFVAANVGIGLGSWIRIEMLSAGEIEEQIGVLLFFFILDIEALWLFILFVLAGTGIGKLQGISLGTPHALSVREAIVSRWIATLALLIAGGFLTYLLGYFPGQQAIPGDIPGILSDILIAITLSVTCLLAAWLLRWWWGCAVASLVYTSVALLWRIAFPDIFVLDLHMLVGFVLYIVLPAVVMAAIGTAIGIHRGGGSNSRAMSEP